MPSLFNIGTELAPFYEALDVTGGELPDDPEFLAKFLAKSEEEAQKIDSYVYLIKLMDMEEAAAKAEAEQWARRAQIRKNSRERLINTLKEHMIRLGHKRLESPKGHVVTLVNNGGSLPIVPPLEDIEGSLVPLIYQKAVIKVDAAKVRAALNADVKLEFAKFGERGKHITISPSRPKAEPSSEEG